ncbi:PREDICTED: transmembrane emp24 domain-containing protein 5-like [Priapulus caudatus]|uniref:Transmembrane emp24 domain-containing protein 5-like n=1 Tax=Priapulus caudatus TaxID=37621 RepID=A0ABM1F966_PRICU|nr:PREDICTED: transmembrane emp24 domain-containing protein 5-like [Priapulus caudatus]
MRGVARPGLVIDGGDLDITFITQSPTGYAIITDIRKSENTHRVTASEDGDYKFCFDNTFSRFSIKLVYFELSVENADGVDDDDDDDEEWMKFVRDEETLGISIDNMKGALAEVKSNLAKSIQLQTLRKAHEAKDRNVMETNYTRVNTWSIVFICILISTGIVQVVMIRGLFDEKSMAHKMMKKLQGQQNQYY